MDVKEANVREFQGSLRRCPHPEMVDEYPARELKKFRLFVVDGGGAGFAVKPDGELICVHNGTGIRGLGRFLVEAAKSAGADHLNHFATEKLNALYAEFREVQRSPFDPQYAPKNWNYSRWGRPDVVFRSL